MTAATAAPSLSVVICAYTPRRWEELCAAVYSVLGQRELAREPELLLVIDHNDELFDMVTARFGDNERVTILRNVEKQGLSGARNTGVAAAHGDIVAFLDDDAHADSDWAHRLLGHYGDSAVAGVGGYATPVWPDGIRPTWMPREFDWVVGCSYTGQPTKLTPVRNPIGCNMSLRRSVVDAVGGFRSEVGRVGATPVGGEETELCLRVGDNAGSNTILFDPSMRVSHHVSADRTTLRYFVRRCYHEGLSKAVVTRLAKGHKSLTSESAYVRTVLPRAVLRETFSSLPGGPSRAAMIVLGLAVTTGGYIRANVAQRTRRSSASRKSRWT